MKLKIIVRYNIVLLWMTRIYFYLVLITFKYQDQNVEIMNKNKIPAEYIRKKNDKTKSNGNWQGINLYCFRSST